LGVSDGTTEGTTVLDINPGGSSSYPNLLGVAGGLLYFTATGPDTAGNQSQGLYSSDGVTWTRLADVSSNARLLAWDTQKAFSAWAMRRTVKSFGWPTSQATAFKWSATSCLAAVRGLQTPRPFSHKASSFYGLQHGVTAKAVRQRRYGAGHARHQRRLALQHPWIAGACQHWRRFGVCGWQQAASAEPFGGTSKRRHLVQRRQQSFTGRPRPSLLARRLHPHFVRERWQLCAHQRFGARCR